MVLAALAAGAFYAAASWDQISALLLLGPDVPALTARTGPEEHLPVPTASEIALARARILFQRGHLLASLQALEGLPPGDVLKPDADFFGRRFSGRF